MKLTWDKNNPNKPQDAYEAVEEAVKEKYGKCGCSLNFIVRIRMKYDYEEKYRERNELFYDDGADWLHPQMVFQYDWWEGEQDVELIGWIPIDEMEYPYNKRWLL